MSGYILHSDLLWNKHNNFIRITIKRNKNEYKKNICICILHVGNKINYAIDLC